MNAVIRDSLGNLAAIAMIQSITVIHGLIENIHEANSSHTGKVISTVGS